MNARKSSELPWSAPVVIAGIPETGKRIELEPDAPTRAAIAKVAGVAGLPRLTAAFDLTPLGDDGVRVAGSVSAIVDQNCVVTLDTIQSKVREDVDLLFMPQPATPAEPPQGPPAVDAAEPPEPLQDGVVDLGAIATEFLLLGIDPYPRKADAVFDAPPADDPADKPFAALAALKKDRDENGR